MPEDPNKLGPTMGVRLYEADIDAFTKIAAHRGLKPAELAREIISDFVRDKEIDLVRHKLSRVEDELDRLRVAMANSTRALLVASGKVTEEQAQNYARVYLEEV